MKSNRLTSAILIVTCALFLQTGCEEEVAEPQQLSPDWFDRFPKPAQQTVASGARTPSLKAARIAFENVVHDFGIVGPETANLCEFKFTNTGKSTLKIEEVTKTCGCTPYLLDKTEYAPGESGTLKVSYITDTQLGPSTKQLTVFSNDHATPEVMLAVKATVQAKIDYEPKMLDLVLKGENAGCPPLAISSVDNQPFSIAYIRSTANCITADFDPTVKSTSFELQPIVDMVKLQTTMNGLVEIGLTHPECKKITVTMKTLPRFTVSPSSLTLRGVAPKSTIKKRVRIMNNYGEPFNLASAGSKNGSVRVVRNTIIPDRGYELELEITPPEMEGRRKSFAEEFSLELSSGLQLKIPCYVFYTGATEAPKAPVEEECTVCGPKIIDPRTGKVTYANPKAKSGT
jgi:hypothetical protein